MTDPTEAEMRDESGYTILGTLADLPEVRDAFGSPILATNKERVALIAAYLAGQRHAHAIRDADDHEPKKP